MNHYFIKIVKATHVTATEKKHLRAFIESGQTQAKVNTKIYTILKGTPIKNGYEYEIMILSPYTRESTKERMYNKQRITIHATTPEATIRLF
jgi:hypothetical protein